jgi:hypothetical protein
MHTEDHAASGGDRLSRTSLYFVNDDNKQYISFPLRLAASLKRRAQLLASRDGVSLVHFIGQAVAEKTRRLRAGSSPAATRPKSATALATRVRCEVMREFTAYTVVGLQPRTIPAGHALFAILAPGETDEIEFTWGSGGDTWYRAPRDLFLKSTRR